MKMSNMFENFSTPSLARSVQEAASQPTPPRTPPPTPMLPYSVFVTNTPVHVNEPRAPQPFFPLNHPGLVRVDKNVPGVGGKSFLQKTKNNVSPEIT